ncbi:MAG: phasin family protein [Alphaproteobacteria bacterium]
MNAKTTAAKPAFDFDMFKSLGQFKAPGFDVEAIMATQRKNLEAAAAANQRAFEGMSAIMRRQAEVARESAEKTMKAMTDVAAASPEERLAKQADFAKTAYASFFQNSKEVYDMAAKTADETIGLINDRFTATIDESKTAFAQK